MSIGSKLKEAREKKKITLAEAYKRTRIHPDILKALERDEYEKILNPTYVRSFLKGYASYLGLDAKKIIEEYNKSRPQKTRYKRPSPALEEPRELRIAEWLSANTAFILKWIVVLALGVVLLGGIFKFIKQRQAARKARTEQLKVKTISKADRTKTALKKTQAPDESSKAVVIPKGEKLVLVINATDDVWLKLKVDEKTIFENTLKKGASESWKAETNFKIWTGKAQALRLKLNGNDIGTAGKGVVKNLVIDREGKR